jgi:hypothetical protein
MFVQDAEMTGNLPTKIGRLAIIFHIKGALSLIGCLLSYLE